MVYCSPTAITWFIHWRSISRVFVCNTRRSFRLSSSKLYNNNMMGALVFFLFFRFLFYAENKPIWRFSGVRADRRRRTDGGVGRSKPRNVSSASIYIMYTAATAENRFTGLPRSATGGAEKSGRATARRSLLRLLLLTKRAPAGDVLGARDQLFVVDARARSSTFQDTWNPPATPAKATEDIVVDDIVVVIA